MINNPEDRPDPVGLGFISPSWQPRLGFAGTYDSAWENSRKPLLPADFNKRFFQSAHPDLIYHGFVKGDEQVKITGMSARGPVHFSLPSIQPVCTVETRGSEIREIGIQPDKIVCNAEDNELIIVWSGSMRTMGGFQDIRVIQCEDIKGV
jgi:hypothetical protein